MSFLELLDLLEIWHLSRRVTVHEVIDVLYREERQFCLAIHPQLTGRPSRLAALEDLIRHILGHPKIWFARCEDVAAAVRPILKAEAGR